MAHHPVRRRGLRHAAVRAGLRAGGDAGADELRQPGARRLRHGRRLRHRDPDGPLGRAVPGLPAGRLRRRRRRSGWCWSARSTSTCTAAAHLDQVLFSIGLVFMAVAAADYFMGSSQRNIQLPAWLQGRREVLGVNVGIYRSFLIVVCGALALGLQLGADAHPLRQPPARRRRRRARGARPRHPGGHRVRRDLRRRLGAGRAGRRAGRRAARARSVLPAASS